LVYFNLLISYLSQKIKSQTFQVFPRTTQVCKQSVDKPLTRTLKTYRRYISRPRRANSRPSSSDPGPPGRQLEVVVKVLLTDGAGRHAGDIAATQTHIIVTTRSRIPTVLSVRVVQREKKWVLTKNTWTSEQRVDCGVRYLWEG